MSSIKLCIFFTLCGCVVVVGQGWHQHQPQNYDSGKYNDMCDDSRPCNQARNLVCVRDGPYRIGRCSCYVRWVYNPTMDTCQDPRLNYPHHHYDQNKPPNPFPSLNGRNYGPGYGSYGQYGGGNGGGPAAVGTPCVDNFICNSALGPLSACIASACQCYDSMSQGKGQVRESNGKCWAVKQENEVCTDMAECVLGGTNLRCVQESGENYGHCKCEGRTCQNSTGALGARAWVWVTLLGLISLAAKFAL